MCTLYSLRITLDFFCHKYVLCVHIRAFMLKYCEIFLNKYYLGRYNYFSFFIILFNFFLFLFRLGILSKWGKRKRKLEWIFQILSRLFSGRGQLKFDQNYTTTDDVIVQGIRVGLRLEGDRYMNLEVGTLYAAPNEVVPMQVVLTFFA